MENDIERSLRTLTNSTIDEFHYMIHGIIPILSNGRKIFISKILFCKSHKLMNWGSIKFSRKYIFKYFLTNKLVLNYNVTPIMVCNFIFSKTYFSVWLFCLYSCYMTEYSILHHQDPTVGRISFTVTWNRILSVTNHGFWMMIYSYILICTSRTCNEVLIE
jgi:hypothetical protein